MKLVTIVGLIVSVNFYLMLGMTGFHYLESGNEEAMRGKSNLYWQDWLAQHTCVNLSELVSVVGVAVNSSDQGFGLFDNQTNSTVWDWHNSFFFASTVVSTIGYGSHAPVTVGGRMFCVFYAIFGIPLTMVLLLAIGEKLYLLSMRVCGKFTGNCSKRVVRIAPVMLVLSLGCTFVIFIPALLYSILEGWSYATAFYFVIISISTIGFGDYVPALEYGHETVGYAILHRTVSIGWIVLGLAWFSSMISAFQNLLGEAVNKTEQAIDEKAKRGNHGDDEARDGGDMDDEKAKNEGLA